MFHAKTFSKTWLIEKVATKSPTYQNQSRSFLARFVWPEIGDKRLGEIKSRDILGIIEDLRSSPVTAERTRVTIQRIFDYAIQKLLVEVNPALPLRGVIERPPVERHRHLNEKELGRFWRSLCAQRAHFNDFSLMKGDRRLPHEDLAGLFDGARSIYAIALVDLIKHIDPTLLDDHLAEFNFAGESRSLSELLDAAHLLERQIWYNRHWNLRVSIEKGHHQVVTEENYSRNPYNPNQTLDSVWAGALASAERTEDEVGLENLGPWDDFEWGMLNGKLSALRWVLGDEWDMLDT